MSRIIAGVQPVREAIMAAPQGIERVLVAGKESPALRALVRLAQSRDVTIEHTQRAHLDRFARGSSHQNVLAVARDLALLTLPALLASEPSLLTVLDRISDPQNFGAVVRSSVALGADGIVWPEHDNAPLSTATFRASAGAIEHASLCRVRSLRDALSEISAAGISVVGLAGDASTDLTHIDLTSPTAIVVGSEGSGLRRNIRSRCDHLARLPTVRVLATLNASVAAGVALYEVRRQRGPTHEGLDESR